jgi:O-acetyl-ADP-ribose deacetylase (regulator of RNase III)
MFEYRAGNLLNDNSDVLIVTVNCIGVMGKGIALDCKIKYPSVFVAYKLACTKKLLYLGGPPIWIPIVESYLKDRKSKNRQRWVVCFPTKDDWRNDSKLNMIRKSLIEFSWQLHNKNIKTMAMPPLGCGNGGLDWKDVEPVIKNYLHHPELTIYLYPPPHVYHDSFYLRPYKISKE